MRRLPTPDARRRVLLSGNHCRVCVPEVTVAMGSLVGFRDRFPQLAAGRFTAVTDCVGDHLTGAAAQGNPDPLLMRLLQHK